MKRLFQLFWLAVSGKEKEFTSGSINRAIVLLAIPMILEMVMESTFAIVDMFFVAKIGTAAVATIGLTEVVLMIIESVAIGIAMASTAMISRRIGEGHREQANVAAFQIIFLAFIVSSLFGIFAFVYARDILSLMGGSAELIAEGHNYTRIILGFNGILFFLFVLNAIFRGAGDAAIAMRTLWIANGLNIVLDPCFIFGLGPFPELGVTGAAVATTIGRGTGVLYQLFYLINGRSLIQIGFRHMKVIKSVLIKLVTVSIGGVSQFLISTASWLFLVRIIARFGDEAIAGYAIAVRVLIFTLLPAWGMANAAATLVGQNLGAGKADRAESSVWRAAFLNMIFLTTVGIFYFIYAKDILGWFSPDKAVLREGIRGLKIVSLGYIFYAYGMVISQAFNGAGDTRTPTAMNVICFWIFQIPVAYILSESFSFASTGVYIGITLSNSLLAVIAVYWFRKGKWKTVQI